MSAYYSEIDPYCCRVLRKQIAAGNLPEGYVDERDIRDVRAEDLDGYDQVHLFAGFGGIPLGFRWAGMPDDFPIWTGGDPCQANTKAGAPHDKGHPDLGSEFMRLVAEVRPRLVLRENPAVTRRGAPWPWWRIRDHLESLDYAVLPFRLRSCCLGADHPRERLFLLAELSDADRERLEGLDREGIAERFVCGETGDRIPRQREDRLPASRICRTGDGFPDRMERTRGSGNAVDPRMAEFIARLILDCKISE